MAVQGGRTITMGTNICTYFLGEVNKNYGDEHLCNDIYCALQAYPSLEKVILLRRPPRFDPISIDPLELKPQLSRFGDSVLFELWCNSSFKKKIFLGDHQLPHRLDDEHNAVFGNADQHPYDGLHMNGNAGRLVFQESILNILNGAGIIDVPEGRKTNQGRYKRAGQNTQYQEERPYGRKTSDGKTIPTGPKHHQDRGAGHYDPLKLFRERLSSSRKESSHPSDQITQHQKRDDSVFQADGNKRVNESSRVSVIRSSMLHSNYSIPVSNPFQILGN